MFRKQETDGTKRGGIRDPMGRGRYIKINERERVQRKIKRRDEWGGYEWRKKDRRWKRRRKEGEIGRGRIWHLRQATQISSAILSRQRRDIGRFPNRGKLPRGFSLCVPLNDLAEWRTRSSVESFVVFDSQRTTRDNQDFLTWASLSHLYVSCDLAKRVKDRRFLRLISRCRITALILDRGDNSANILSRILKFYN